jgi:carboxynorspermidine decarboxylase
MAKTHYLNAAARKAARKAAAQDFPASLTNKVARTPCFLINEAPLRRNLEILADVKKRSGAKILVALKAFAMPRAFPIMKEYLDGVCASGPIEAELGRRFFGKGVHTFGPAYSEEAMKQLLAYSDAIIFNSVSQWKKYRKMIANNERKVEVGLRVNPGYSEIDTDLYNPVLPAAGMGILPEELEGEDLKGVDGLHFHALCEQGSETLGRVLKSFEKKYGKKIAKMKWVNFGGGHHITRSDYNRELLIKLIKDFKKKYGVQVHLEPGEAVVLNTGVLVSTILDVINRKGKGILVMDTSAETQMPDVLAMPYQPDIVGVGEKLKGKRNYILRGLTCLAGDIIGEYSFEKEPKVGDRLVFIDMALYTIVKMTTFNGVKLPYIAFYNAAGHIELIKSFGYEDYKSRLG